MAATEQELNDFRLSVRAEVRERLDAFLQELTVVMAERFGQAEPGISREDAVALVRQEMPKQEVPDVRGQVEAAFEERPDPIPDLKAEMLKQRLHINQVCDRIGAPRMEA